MPVSRFLTLSALSKAKRWKGAAFNAPFDCIGAAELLYKLPLLPVVVMPHYPSQKILGRLLQAGINISIAGLSWWQKQKDLHGEAAVSISFNKNPCSITPQIPRDWSLPELLINKPTQILWYPSLKPLNTATKKANKLTSLKLGQTGRLFYKKMYAEESMNKLALLRRHWLSCVDVSAHPQIFLSFFDLPCASAVRKAAHQLQIISIHAFYATHNPCLILSTST